MDEKIKLEIFHGIWYTIHKLAAKAVTPEKKASYRQYIKDLSEETLPCSECCQHMKQYLIENPLEKELNYFVWSWRFHNAVNKRLGKQEFSFDMANSMYVDNQFICHQCDNKGGQEQVLHANIGKFEY